MSEETVTVRLPKKLVAELKNIQDSLGTKSIAEAAEIIFKFSNSPLSFLALALEARGDAKDILREIKTLNENLEKILNLLQEKAK